MISSKTACEIIRKLSDISEKDHFGSDAFYANKRIFATVWHNENKVNVRLTPELQRQFLETDGEAFEEIDNAWGRQGWTTIQLEFVDKSLFSDAINAAWNYSAIKTKSKPKNILKVPSVKSKRPKKVSTSGFSRRKEKK